MNIAAQTKSPEKSMLLGIDGGGTKTVAWLGTAQGGRLELMGQGQGGPSNPRAVGFDSAYENIQQSVQSAFENANISDTAVNVACLCLAGTGRQFERDKVLEWTRQVRLASESILVSEAEVVLAAAQQDDSRPLLKRTEVALICGTGSLAWGRNAVDSTPVRCGGWGYLLGDEGSGFWLGQQVVQLACKVSDGRAKDATLLEQVLSQLQFESAEELVAWCYEHPGSRERIASLAPLAFQESFNDSPGNIARLWKEIAERGAQEIAMMIATVVGRLQSAEYELAMAGSVVQHQSYYRSLIMQKLSELNCTPEAMHLVEQPVQGALRLAFQHSIRTLARQ